MPSLKITDTAILRQMKVGMFYTDTAVKRLQLYKSQNGGSWYFRTLAGGRKKFSDHPVIDYVNVSLNSIPYRGGYELCQ